MLCSYLGVSGLAGVMIMVISMPLNMKLGKMMGKYTKLTMELRDKRVKFTNELLQVRYDAVTGPLQSRYCASSSPTSCCV